MPPVRGGPGAGGGSVSPWPVSGRVPGLMSVQGPRLQRPKFRGGFSCRVPLGCSLLCAGTIPEPLGINPIAAAVEPAPPGGMAPSCCLCPESTWIHPKSFPSSLGRASRLFHAGRPMAFPAGTVRALCWEALYAWGHQTPHFLLISPQNRSFCRVFGCRRLGDEPVPIPSHPPCPFPVAAGKGRGHACRGVSVCVSECTETGQEPGRAVTHREQPDGIFQLRSLCATAGVAVTLPW